MGRYGLMLSPSRSWTASKAPIQTKAVAGASVASRDVNWSHLNCWGSIGLKWST